MSRVMATSVEPETVAGKIRALMAEEFITEAELSRQTQIPQATLHKVLAGKTADPRCSTLAIIANRFNVSVDYLVGGVRHNAVRKQVDVPIQSIPVLSWQDCARAKSVIAAIADSRHQQWVITEFVNDNAYALVTRNSMKRLFEVPTTLVINPDASPSDGDLVVVQYANTDEATLRAFSSDGPVVRLNPINDLSHSEELTDAMSIVGVVVQARKGRAL